MPEPADTFEHAGLQVRILWEEYTDENDNPRTNQDGNIGRMFCEHRDYDLGDEDAEDPRGQMVVCDRCGGTGDDPDQHYAVVNAAAFGLRVIQADFDSLEHADAFIEHNQPREERWIAEVQSCPKCEGEGEVELSMIEWLRDVKEARVALPLFLYDHSGISMTCGGNLLANADTMSRQGRFMGDDAGWDTSSVGLIYFDPELAERWGCPQDEWTDEQIEKSLNAEVQEYDAFLRGYVFGFEVLDEDGEVVESCWGFLETEPWSSDNNVHQEARAAAGYCRRQIEREKIEAHRWACADVVTV